MESDISFIITVFNKEKELPAMIQSIMRQVGELNCEYIFVDDASADNSIKIIEEFCKGVANFTIIGNKENMGPAIRLNQGCIAASGKYLFLMDADDILVQNALSIMLNYIKKENADFVFGRSKVTDQDQNSLLEIELSNKCEYQVSTNPLNTVLNGRYVRMSYLTTKKLYIKSGGADDKIFIQDESLPLRLAYNAKKIITLNEPAIYSAKNDKSLSINKSQQMHDRFYAYYFALIEFKQLSNNDKKLMYKRAISSIWKAKKISASITDKLFFITYLITKISPSNVHIQKLERYKNFMDTLKNVRKVY